MSQFFGVYPALVSPLQEHGGINATVVKELVDWQLDCGVHGFYICGGTGEGLLLSPDERKQMLEATVAAADGRGKVIAHVAALDTATAMDLAAHAEANGADAVAAIPPIYYRVDNQGLLEHYRLIAGASKLPLFLYHIPAMTQQPLSADLMKQLLSIDTFRGIKFSDYNHFLMRFLSKLGDDVVIFSGNDEVFLSGLTMGADGGIGLTYNFMPRVYVGIYEAFRSADFATARKLQQTSADLIEIMMEVYGMGVAKAALEHLGFEVGLPRRPLRPLSDLERGLLAEKLDSLGLVR
jgi:N-acetylneuraminate lyase